MQLTFSKMYYIFDTSMSRAHHQNFFKDLPFLYDINGISLKILLNKGCFSNAICSW